MPDETKFDFPEVVGTVSVYKEYVNALPSVLEIVKPQEFVPTEFEVIVKEAEGVETAFWTNAVVAIWVEPVPAVAVGAVGIPVSAGESSGA